MYNAEHCSSASKEQKIQPSLIKSVTQFDSKTKIRRPPNAFMLYARENRRKVAADNPTVNNKNISTLLGKLWRSLDSTSKARYYDAAKMMDKIHKQKFPDYVYNPKEARIRKQTKEELKRLKKQPGSGATFAKDQISIDEKNVNKSQNYNEFDVKNNSIKIEYVEGNVKSIEDQVTEKITSSPKYIPNMPQVKCRIRPAPSVYQTSTSEKTYPSTADKSHPAASEESHPTPAEEFPTSLITTTTSQSSFESATAPNRMAYQSFPRPGHWIPDAAEQNVHPTAFSGMGFYGARPPRPPRYGFGQDAQTYSSAAESPWNPMSTGYGARYFLSQYRSMCPQFQIAAPERFYQAKPFSTMPTSTQASNNVKTETEPAEESENSNPTNGSSGWNMKRPYPLLQHCPIFRPYSMPYAAYYYPDAEAFYSGSIYGLNNDDLTGYDKSYSWPMAAGNYYRGMAFAPPTRPYMEQGETVPPSYDNHDTSGIASGGTESPSLVVDSVDEESKRDVQSSHVEEPVASSGISTFDGAISSSMNILNSTSGFIQEPEKFPVVRQRKSPPKKSSIWRTNN